MVRVVGVEPTLLSESDFKESRVFPRPHNQYKVATEIAHKFVAQHLTGT